MYIHMCVYIHTYVYSYILMYVYTSSSYWTVYKKFASQSHHKYKIMIFFSGYVNYEAKFSFFILLHKRSGDTDL